MSNKSILNTINQLETYADLLKETATTLKKELKGNGAPKSSTLRGNITKNQVLNVLKKAQRTRLKKPRGNVAE